MLFTGGGKGLESFFHNCFFCIFLCFRLTVIVLTIIISLYSASQLFQSKGGILYEFRRSNISANDFGFVLNENNCNLITVLELLIGGPICMFLLFMHTCYTMCCRSSEHEKVEKIKRKIHFKQNELANKTDVKSQKKLMELNQKLEDLRQEKNPSILKAILKEIFYMLLFAICAAIQVIIIVMLASTKSKLVLCTKDNANCTFIDRFAILAQLSLFLWMSMLLLSVIVVCILTDHRRKYKKEKNEVKVSGYTF